MTPEVISRVLDLLGPLLGALVGGFITLAVSLSLQARQHRWEKAEKLAELKREALSALLEWIEPMRNAYITASQMAASAEQGLVAKQQVAEEWPNLLDELVEQDLPANLRAVLPGDLYERARRIVLSFNGLKYEVLKDWQSSHPIQRGQDEPSEPIRGIAEIGQAIDVLEAEVRSLFHGTYV